MSARKLKAKVAAITLLGSLLLTGCAQPEAQPAPAEPSATSWAIPTSPPAAAPQELPYLGYESVVMTPAADNAARPTGASARPTAQGAVVFDAVDGRALGILASINVTPIVQRAPGWVRVMLPSRRMLPGQARSGDRALTRYTPEPYVNRGTGWVREADVVVETGLPRVFVNKTTGELAVVRADEQLVAKYPAKIGQDVPTGPTYIPGGPGSNACGKAAPIMLSAQSETQDGYRGQSVSPIFINGPSPECTYSAQDVADMTPRMIQLSPDDAISLAALVKPGVYVHVVGGKSPLGVKV